MYCVTHGEHVLSTRDSSVRDYACIFLSEEKTCLEWKALYKGYSSGSRNCQGRGKKLNGGCPIAVSL